MKTWLWLEARCVSVNSLLISAASSVPSSTRAQGPRSRRLVGCHTEFDSANQCVEPTWLAGGCCASRKFEALSERPASDPAVSITVTKGRYPGSPLRPLQVPLPSGRKAPAARPSSVTRRLRELPHLELYRKARGWVGEKIFESRNIDGTLS